MVNDLLASSWYLSLSKENEGHSEKLCTDKKRAEKNYCCIFMAKHSCLFHFLRFSSVCINSAWRTMLFCPKNRRWKRWQFISHPQHPVLYDIRKAPSHLRPSVRPPSVSMYNRYESTTMCVVYHHLPSLFMQCNISDPDAALYYQTQCLVNHLAADMTWHIKSKCCYYFICIVDIGFSTPWFSKQLSWKKGLQLLQDKRYVDLRIFK